MRKRFLQLHQTLFYPAFLGVLLVGFFQLFLGISFRRLPEIDLLWLTLNLWFIFYFCAAYLVLLEADEEDFRLGAFLANFAEVLVILYASTTLTQADPFGLHGKSPGSTPGWPTGDIEFRKIFVSWLLIPITAGLANWFSKRWVKGLLSLTVVLIAATGWCMSSRHMLSHCGAVTFTILMFIALIVYYVALSKNRPWCGDFRRTKGWADCKSGGG